MNSLDLDGVTDHECIYLDIEDHSSPTQQALRNVDSLVSGMPG